MVKSTRLIGTNVIAADRNVINNNFELHDESINKILESLNIENRTLAISTIDIFSGNSQTPIPTVNTVNTNGSIKALGNCNIGGNITGKSITLDNGTGAKLNKGNLEVLDSASIIDFRGQLKIGSESVYTTYTDLFEAWKKITYTSGGNNYETIEGEPDNIIGLISLKNKSGMILNFSGYTSANVNLNVNRVKLSTTNISVGHTCTIVAVTDNTNNFFLEITNIADLSVGGDSVAIKFDKTYQSITLVYSGSVWIPVNMQNCVYVSSLT